MGRMADYAFSLQCRALTLARCNMAFCIAIFYTSRMLNSDFNHQQTQAHYKRSQCTDAVPTLHHTEHIGTYVLRLRHLRKFGSELADIRPRMPCSGKGALMCKLHGTRPNAI